MLRTPIRLSIVNWRTNENLPYLAAPASFKRLLGGREDDALSKRDACNSEREVETFQILLVLEALVAILLYPAGKEEFV